MKDKKKTSNRKDVKPEIIVHVLDYIETNDKEAKIQAIEKLSDYAKRFNIPLRLNASEANIKLHLKEFILNHKGYNTTIHNLFNSLHYKHDEA